MADVVVDLVQRDTVMPSRLVGREKGKLTVEELKIAIQAQRKVERIFLSGGFSRPLPKCCIPGLRM